MNRALHLALAALMFGSAVNAQDVPEDRTSRFRDPRAASYWSIIPGGGHLYSGEYEKGIALLGGSIGLLAAGHYASREQCMLFDNIDPTTNTLTVVRACERHRGWFALSIAAASGLWLAGIFDAPDSAHRANFRNGWTQLVPFARVRMAVMPEPGGAAITARIQLR
ncbi:MAG TPA: hypothetical protein VMM77_10090 [Gemmatimonadaceae bacterium]|nr:hypothetical protein [Gemmatimonadaceae bacterium]